MARKEIKYCGLCGAKLLEGLDNAEKYMIIPGYYYSVNYTRYDIETGKRQYFKRFYCPNKTWLFNKHDDYAIGDIIKK